MLYFSETVCVLTSFSSLSALDGDRESSNGFRFRRYPGPSPLASELILVRREGTADWSGDGVAWVSSLPRRGRGGMRYSVESAAEKPADSEGGYSGVKVRRRP